MLPLPALRVFEAASRNRPFRQVAVELHLSPSAGLSALHVLKQQGKANATAVRAAQRLVQIALNIYRAGTWAYTKAIT